MIIINTNIWNIKQLDKLKFEKPIKKSIAQVAQNVRTDAIKNAPFKSWTLRRSISIIEKDNWYTNIVWTNVKYASIQEFWGTITAKNKKYLTFKINNKWVRVKSVKIRAKRYFQRAFDDNIKQISDIFNKNINDYLKKNL